MKFYTVGAERTRTGKQINTIEIQADSLEKAIDIARTIDNLGDLGFFEEEVEFSASSFHAEEFTPTGSIELRCIAAQPNAGCPWDSRGRDGYEVCTVCGAIRQHVPPETGS